MADRHHFGHFRAYLTLVVTDFLFALESQEKKKTLSMFLKHSRQQSRPSLQFPSSTVRKIPRDSKKFHGLMRFRMMSGQQPKREWVHVERAARGLPTLMNPVTGVCVVASHSVGGRAHHRMLEVIA